MRNLQQNMENKFLSMALDGKELDNQSPLNCSPFVFFNEQNHPKQAKASNQGFVMVTSGVF